MRNIMLSSMLVVLLGAGITLADDTVWTRTWNAGGRVNARAIVALGDDYVVSGGVQDTLSQMSDIYVIRYTGTGEQSWARVFDPDSFARDAYLAAGPGGEIYVSMRVKMTPTSAMIMRLDANGDTVWTRTRPNSCCTELFADAGGIWLLGALGAPQPRDTLWLGRLDTDGNETVHKSWRIGQRHNVNGFCRTGSGQMVGSVAIAFDGPVFQPVLVGFSSVGDTLWTRRLPPEQATTGLAVAPVGADGFYFLARVDDRTVLSRMSASGDTVWNRIIPRTGIASDLALDQDGNAYVVANVGDDINLMQWSPDGQLLGQLQGGTPEADLAMAIAVGADDRPVITGATGGGLTALTMKFRPASGIAGPQPGPNPAGVRLAGHLSGRPRLAVSRAGSYRLSLFSADGRELAQRTAWLDPGAHELGLDAGTGVRFLVVSGPSGAGRFKLVRAD